MKEKNRNVIVLYSPVSERYWHVGCNGKIQNNQIRVGGCWFPFDKRWNVKLKNKSNERNKTKSYS